MFVTDRDFEQYVISGKQEELRTIGGCKHSIVIFRIKDDVKKRNNKRKLPLI
jgi:hypothetical protein